MILPETIVPYGNIPSAILLLQDDESSHDAVFQSGISEQIGPKNTTAYLSRMVNATINKGGAAIRSALDEFKRQDPLKKGPERSLRPTIRKQESYDFCAEILDSVRPPYSLECLQKEFLRVGTADGTLYPSDQTLISWNSFPRWLDVKTSIKALEAATRSKDLQVKEEAIVKVYGSPVQKVNLEEIPGIEIFWFSKHGVFLGRRIRSNLPTNQIGIMVFFAEITDKNKSMKVRVVSDQSFALELNRPLHAYDIHTFIKNGKSLVAIDKFPLSTFTDSWTLDSVNRLYGTIFQRNGSFKVEYSSQSHETWSEMDSNLLCLTQEPYAPMISFQVYRQPQTFGADFNFADIRMGSQMMKWTSLTGTPGWLYTKGPLGLPVVKFRSDSSMKLNSYTICSFITMTILIRFNALPNNFVNMQEYISFPGKRKFAIQVIGNGMYGQGVLQLYNEYDNTIVPVATVKQGVPYLLVLRVNRRNTSDMYSVYGISVGIQELAVLHENPVSYSHSKCSPTDAMETRGMIVGNGDIDVGWVRLFDYSIDSRMKREAMNDWVR